MRQGGPFQQQVVAEIWRLISEADTARAQSKTKRRSNKPSPRANRPPPAKAAFSPGRTTTLSALSDAMREQHVLKTGSALRDFFLAAKGKGPLPKSRDAAVSVILRHLDELSEEAYSAALAYVRNSPADEGTASDDFNRWFHLIHSKGEQ
jgi:hypothetical protein